MSEAETIGSTNSAPDAAPDGKRPSPELPSRSNRPADVHEAPPKPRRGKTVHGEAANAGHRVLAPDDAEVEAYLETALKAPVPERPPPIAPAGPHRSSRRPEPDTVVVLDFGSQFAQLIARRVRELNVYSELLPHDTPWAEIERRRPRAIILSGGPSSVYDDDAPRPDPMVWSGRVPVLGICYGAHLMAHELGGDVLPATKREYGPATVTFTADDGLFRGLDREQPVWMSHGDSITRLPDGLPSDRPDRLDAVRRPRRPGSAAVRDPVPPRGRPHAARPGRPAQLRARHRRRPADLDAGQLHRLDRRRDPGPGRRPCPGGRLGRAGHLRAVAAGSTRRSPRRSFTARSATA